MGLEPAFGEVGAGCLGLSHGFVWREGFGAFCFDAEFVLLGGRVAMSGHVYADVLEIVAAVGDAATTQQSAAGDAGEDWLEVRGHVGREFAFVGVALLFGGFEAGHGYVSLVIG